MTNPLLNGTGLPQFDKIKPEHVIPAIEKILEDAEQELAAVEAETEITWDSIFGRLDRTNHRIHMAWGPVNHLLNTRSTDALRKAHETVLPKVVSFSLRFSQSEPLYKAYCQLRDSQNWQTFDKAQQRIIKAHIRDAELAGIALEGQNKLRFNEISKRLSELSTKFSNQVLDATKEYEMVLKNKAEVDGLPASLLNLAAQSYNVANQTETAQAESGPWRFTLDFPIYMPFMQHATRRDLREKIYRAHISKAAGGKFDNTPLILEILKLRQEKAKLLGFNTFAEVSMAKKMAREVSAVDKLLEDLRAASWEPGKQEITDLKAFANAHGQQQPLENWDLTYWAEKRREDKFQFTDEELKPYFPLASVMDGLFALCHKLFGISVKAADGETEIWHPDVRFFKIFDKNGQHIASFFLDPFSRPEDKRGGAWMDDCIGRAKHGSELRLPVAYLVCNSTPPVGDKPSLMSFQEVTTLFHEFGHGLQHMLTIIDQPGAAGINGIEWDAVELPSQFMENWCYHRKTLLGLAKHYQTGATLPEELFQKIVKSRTYLAATYMLRQLRFAMTDLQLHHRFDPSNETALFSVAHDMGVKTAVIPPLQEDRMLCSFSHIFAGGYAAGYFSYKWAEVLSADAFSAFEDAGLDDETAMTQTGKKFKDTILSLGGSEHPMDVFRKFRGRDPSPRPLLKHNGLLAPA